jgi:hypothetical protein
MRETKVHSIKHKALAIEAPGPALSGGRLKHWVKVKNRQHPAMSRVMEAFRQRFST